MKIVKWANYYDYDDMDLKDILSKYKEVVDNIENPNNTKKGIIGVSDYINFIFENNVIYPKIKPLKKEIEEYYGKKYIIDAEITNKLKRILNNLKHDIKVEEIILPKFGDPFDYYGFEQGIKLYNEIRRSLNWLYENNCLKNKINEYIVFLGDNFTYSSKISNPVNKYFIDIESLNNTYKKLAGSCLEDLIALSLAYNPNIRSQLNPYIDTKFIDLRKIKKAEEYIDQVVNKGNLVQNESITSNYIFAMDRLNNYILGKISNPQPTSLLTTIEVRKENIFFDLETGTVFFQDKKQFKLQKDKLPYKILSLLWPNRRITDNNGEFLKKGKMTSLEKISQRLDNKSLEKSIKGNKTNLMRLLNDSILKDIRPKFEDLGIIFEINDGILIIEKYKK